MSTDKMTLGDRAGMEAQKPKTHRELKIDEWKGKLVNPWHSALLFAYMKANPDMELKVTDRNNPKGLAGTVFNRNGALAVRVGNSISLLNGGFNEGRFVWTDESAERLGGYEFDSEMREAELSIRALSKGFARDLAIPKKEEVRVEKKMETFGSLLRTILSRRRGGYTVHARGSEHMIESIYSKCSRRESFNLTELAKKEFMPIYEEDGITEVLLDDGRIEGDLVDVLKNFGYDLDYCMPSKVTIFKKGIQFYPPDPQI